MCPSSRLCQKKKREEKRKGKEKGKGKAKARHASLAGPLIGPWAQARPLLVAASGRLLGRINNLPTHTTTPAPAKWVGAEAFPSPSTGELCPALSIFLGPKKKFASLTFPLRIIPIPTPSHPVARLYKYSLSLPPLPTARRYLSSLPATVVPHLCAVKMLASRLSRAVSPPSRSLARALASSHRTRHAALSQLLTRASRDSSPGPLPSQPARPPSPEHPWPTDLPAMSPQPPRVRARSRVP